MGRRGEGTPAPPVSGEARVLRVRDLRVVFRGRGKPLVAVDGVSLDVGPGETLGVVGESGSGKSTLGRAIVGLVKPERGRIELPGSFQTNVGRVGRGGGGRGRFVQMVFQDPGGSLNPRMRVWRAVAEPIEVHEGISRRGELRERARAILARCGLEEGCMDRYPHELSGGQRQRVAIARALAVRPRLLICDEPTSALDVSVQAQVLNLLRDVREQFGLSCLFISHDIGVVEHMADRIVVMRRGRVVESGARERVLRHPEAPYTRELLEAAPRLTEIDPGFHRGTPGRSPGDERTWEGEPGEAPG